MKELLAHRPSLRRGTRLRESASAIPSALAILALTLIAVGASLFEASNRFQTGHQSSRWSQAEQAAEAGADIAMMTAQKTSWTTDGWSGAPGAPGASPVTKTVTLTSGASGPI